MHEQRAMREAERQWRRDLRQRLEERIEPPTGMAIVVDPGLYATVDDIQRLGELYQTKGLDMSPEQIARRLRHHGLRAAYSVWESELSNRYRDRPIPEGFEEMETFPYEEFADADDRHRWEEIKREYGIQRSGGTRPRPHQVLAMMSTPLLSSPRSPRSILMEERGWGIWEGTGPWVGWSRPLWRDTSIGELLCLFADAWQVWEVAAVTRQWNARLVAVPLTPTELATLAARLPPIPPGTRSQELQQTQRPLAEDHPR